MRANHTTRLVACFIAAAAVAALSVEFAAARGGGGRGGGGGFGGGGARGGFGGGGGGMARPGGGGMARPGGGMGGGGMARPGGGMGGGGMARPGGGGMPNMSRPSMGNVGGGGPAMARPSLPSGGARPSLGGMGGPGAIGGARPQLPTAGNRPNIQPPGALMPATRPSLGGGGLDRPNIGGGGLGGGDRPSFANLDRPTTLPGAITRPGGGGGGIPPGGGGNRPGGGGDRPIIGGGGNRPGGGNVIGGGGNINIGNDVNIGGGNWNRPGWGLGNRPGSDIWSQNWTDHCINDHHDWYHGCWNNHWGNNWYAPLAWGAVGWGLGSWYGGYGGSYYNPYYDTSAVATVPYDYSQPVVVNNYPTIDAAGGVAQSAQPPPANNVALQQFDQGMASFKAGDYRGALSQFDGALKQLPNDPVVHEVRALALFALGQYKPAAAVLDSLLATAPGMDWTTMSSLYGNVDDYTAQLRKLEAYCKTNPTDASAYFVLAYHYLVTGSKDAAVGALKVVVQQQPKDATAKRMLDSLNPPEQPAATAIAATTPPPPADAPQTDLVGSWQAKAGDTTIALTIGEDSQFSWKATSAKQKPVELKGEIQASSDTLVLDSKEQGSMAGNVKSGGPDKWQFALAGAPPTDPGLSFQRVNN